MKPAMMHRLPRVKLSANLDGDKMMTGRKIMKDISMNTPPPAKNAKKYTSCVPDGMLRP